MQGEKDWTENKKSRGRGGCKPGKFEQVAGKLGLEEPGSGASRRGDRGQGPPEQMELCSEIDDIQLVGGSSNCSGELQLKHQGVWKGVDDQEWDLKLADVVCRHLDCGSVVQVSSKPHESLPKWSITPSCLNSGLRKCLTKRTTLIPSILEISCSDSVRLVNGTSLCSGRLEVKSNQQWSSVCEDDFDQQDAEVVCRELGCGAPSVLQGALYGEVEAPVWSEEFQCGGHESTLLDCRTSGSARNTCSPGKAVGLTCSEPETVQLVRGSGRCDGEIDGVSEAKQQGFRVLMGSDFTITCSTEPQYPGGSFQLIFTTSATSQNYTLPAVNHSAYFLFPAADHTHQGIYRCVYHIYVFSHNFSSESQPLHLTVAGNSTRW